MRRALVLGGTGHVGGAVLAGLARAGVPAELTYHRNEARAAELTRAGHVAHQLDLRDAEAVRALIASLAEPPDVLIHCAAHADWRTFDALDVEGWDAVQAVGVRAPFVAIQALAPRLAGRGGDIVLCAGLSAAKPVPAHAQAAAAHAGLAGLTRALARTLGPQKIRINLVAVGILDGGTATRIGASFARDHKRFTALGRTGTAAEIAEAIVWLALENSYASGMVVPLAGGI